MKQILFFIFIISINFEIKAVTPLAAGDIAFTGFIGTPNDPTPDEFSFVLLKTIDNTTTIKFTDNGWIGAPTNAFRAGETIITWTPPAGGLAAGKEIHIVGTTATLAGGGSGGTVTGTTLSLNGNNGDQVLAYIGTEASPTFISAIHTNVNTVADLDPSNTNTTVWDGAANESASSALPPGLVNGSTAIWLGVEGDLSSQRGNGKFQAGALNLSTAANVRTAVNNRLNWIGEPLGQPAMPAFTLPTNAVFLTSVAAIFSTQPVASSSCASLAASFNVTTDQSGMSFVWQEAATAGFASPTNLSTGGLYTISSTTNTSTLTISDNTSKNGKFYRCVGTNSGAIVTNSNIVGLTATANLLSGNVSFNQTVGPGNASFFFASSCRLLAKVVPGNISGNVTVDSWLEGSVPNVAGVPFVQRHYQITTSSGSTATVTLYFSQIDFNNYNNFNVSTLDNIPTGPGDATGIGNLRITKYNGSSNDFTGLPASFTSGSSTIDPVNSDIVWNSTASRWEITFTVNGFSGFTVQSAVAAPLPVTLINFSGKINDEKAAALNWNVAEQVDIQEYIVEKSDDANSFNPI